MLRQRGRRCLLRKSGERPPCHGDSRPTKAGFYCRDRPPRPAVSAVPGRTRSPASTAVTVQGSRERELSQAPRANHVMVCKPQRLLPGPCPRLWRVRVHACARLPSLPAGSREVFYRELAGGYTRELPAERSATGPRPSLWRACVYTRARSFL